VQTLHPKKSIHSHCAATRCQGYRLVGHVFRPENCRVTPARPVQILGSIRWALVGAMALRAYASERLTQDVDIVIHADDEQAARVAFMSAGYWIGDSLPIGGCTAYPTDGAGYSINVLAFDEPWLNEALAQPMYDLAGFPVLARQFLILMKLQAGRVQDVADVTRLLRQADQTERAVARATAASLLANANTAPTLF